MSTLPTVDGALAGKAALVTAGSRNLGPVIVERLARAGTTGAVNYRESREAAETLVERLRAADGRAHLAVRGDTSSGAGVTALVEAALEGLGGRVDVLVNNSGPWGSEPSSTCRSRRGTSS